MLSAAAVVIALLCPGARVDGVGARVERVQNIAGRVEGVVVSGAVDVEVLATDDDAVSVAVSAEANLQPMVLASTSDGVLRIAVQGEPVSVEGIVVRVRMRTPTSAVAAGAARLTTPLRGRARAEASGAARARISGAPETLTIIGRGAATIDATQVVVDDTLVEVNGATEIEVGPVRELQVNGTGVGRVRYRGNPQLRTSVSPTVKVTRFRP